LLLFVYFYFYLLSRFFSHCSPFIFACHHYLAVAPPPTIRRDR
jgi:hypothetical protein